MRFRSDASASERNGPDCWRRPLLRSLHAHGCGMAQWSGGRQRSSTHFVQVCAVVHQHIAHLLNAATMAPPCASAHERPIVRRRPAPPVPANPRADSRLARSARARSRLDRALPLTGHDIISRIEPTTFRFAYCAIRSVLHAHPSLRRAARDGAVGCAAFRLSHAYAAPLCGALTRARGS